MKRAVSWGLLAVFCAAAQASAAGEPVAVIVRTRNRQGYAFQTSIEEDGRYVRRFRKDGGPDIAEAPVIGEGVLSEADRTHLAKIVDLAGFFALSEDSTRKDPAHHGALSEFEGELRVKRGSFEKTVRFGPDVDSIPEGAAAVLGEVSRLTQVKG